MKTAFGEKSLFGLHFLAMTLLVRLCGFSKYIIANLCWKFKNL